MQDLPPILTGKDTDAPSVFEARALVREARRQKGLGAAAVPRLCLLDPDGDIVRHLRRAGLAAPAPGWACYHSEMDVFDLGGIEAGIVGCAVGAPYAVIVAEQMSVCGAELVLSLTSAGRIALPEGGPEFVLIGRALRDEGTSYHYAPPGDWAAADPALVAGAGAALAAAGTVHVAGASWTTDAPFRETAGAIAAARARGILCVEMEAAGLYASAAARGTRLLCFAHVTNSMAAAGDDFEKGEAGGAPAALALLGTAARGLLGE